MIAISIITPLYNSAEFLSDTIRSVQNQTFNNWEMILVDDCSADQSSGIAQSFADRDSRIRLIRLNKNLGAAVARNVAMEAAQGRYIAFLDSDDLWLPSKLETQLSFMQKKGIDFSFSAYEKIDEQGKPLGFMGVPAKINYNQLLKCCVIGCLTAMYDTEKLGKVYMPLVRKRQDFGLWLRLLKKTEFAYGIQEGLGQYRVRNDSISSNKVSAAIFNWRVYREVEKLSLLKSSYYFSHYLVRGVLRQKYPFLAKKLNFLD